MTSSDTMVKIRALEVRPAIRAISPFSFTLILCSRDHAGGVLLLGAMHVFTRFLFVQEFECRWAGKNTAPNGSQISSTVLFFQYPSYRDLPKEKGKYTKIELGNGRDTTLAHLTRPMIEFDHPFTQRVGVRRYPHSRVRYIVPRTTMAFSCSRLRVSVPAGNLRTLLDAPPGEICVPFCARELTDCQARGVFTCIVGFPEADVSCPLSWVVTQAENTGFEVNIDVPGIHCSATLLQSKLNLPSAGTSNRLVRREKAQGLSLVSEG